MFENGQIVENFLNYWRKSGHQRVGFMYGRYEAYENAPLGIRAVVSAIYEPPQVYNKKILDFYSKIYVLFEWYAIDYDRVECWTSTARSEWGEN